MSDQERTVFTVPELAERWQVHINTILNMIKDKRLESFSIGNRHRIPAQQIYEFESRGGDGPISMPERKKRPEKKRAIR